MSTRVSPPLFPVYRILLFCAIGAWSVFAPLVQAYGQGSDTKLPIQILNAQDLTVSRSPDGSEVNKLIGDVRLQQGESFMSCDSAYINLATNNVEAFGNVVITQPGGTQVQSDYLRYTGNTRMAYLQTNVSLTDGKNHLWSEELTYDLSTKIGTYANGGTLQSEATTLSSNSGVYNARSKDSRFTGDVLVNDPEYNVTSEDLGYNTETKVVTFYGPSIVINDKSELRTSSGIWDARQEIARFNVRSSIRNKEQYIEADTMRYSRVTGFGVAKGNVIALDTIQKTTLYSGYGSFNEITRQLYAAQKPVLKHVTNNDSFFIRADTFFSAHVRKPVVVDTSLISLPDSVQILKKDKPVKLSRRGRKQRTDHSPAILQPSSNDPQTTVRPTNPADIPDTTMPRFYTGYHHVLVFSDSLQARCDSIIYSGVDSTMRLIDDPVAWSRRSQITGDTILLILDSNKLNQLFVPDKAFVVSRSGPDRAGLYDQIQGKTLTGYFENNQINLMVVFPNAESIYYPKDETDAYLGVNQSSSERMRIFFQDQQISRILLEQEPKQTMTPLTDVNIPSMRLSRFQWRESERPKTRESLFE